MTSRQIEMTWRCTSCSAKNLGRFKSCQKCNNPKDGSEEYEMPADPSTAASVTEASLLLMATAGPDWRCAYCGSDQRRTDPEPNRQQPKAARDDAERSGESAEERRPSNTGCASCGASALEGEEVPDAPAPTPQAPRPAPPASRTPPPSGSFKTLFLTFAGLVVALGALGAAVGWNRNRPKDFEARVADVKWERVIDVERYQAKGHDGFKEAIPAGALEVKSLGQREHHQEQVFDHFETERYSVTVPDGYRTESYTERVSCGQDCTSSPKSCHESCKSNKNGFATCKTVCSGGGRTCSTKYCNERRTRQVPKTRQESRTRQVSRYRSEPRFAEAFSWIAWEWLPARTVRASGTDVTTRWPEAALNKGLAEGEKERETRRETFRVSLSWDEDQELTFAPASEEAFARFAPGTKHALHSEQGTFTLDGVAVIPNR